MHPLDAPVKLSTPDSREALGAQDEGRRSQKLEGGAHTGSNVGPEEARHSSLFGWTRLVVMEQTIAYASLICGSHDCLHSAARWLQCPEPQNMGTEGSNPGAPPVLFLPMRERLFYA